MSDVRKRLKSPVVVLPGVGHMHVPGEDEKDAARVFYVAGYSGYAEVGDGGGWRKAIWKAFL